MGEQSWRVIVLLLLFPLDLYGNHSTVNACLLGGCRHFSR